MNKFAFFLCGCAFFVSDIALATTVCSGGHSYISQCGQYKVGTNWLKGLISEDSKDLYDYSSNNNNIENLRKFFNGKSFQYTKPNGEIATASDAEVKQARDTIINQLCNPDNVTCSVCQSNANCDSSFYKDSSSEWTRFYGSVNCYFNTFSDSTGTFQYENDDNNEVVNCYFGTETKGSSLQNITLQQELEHDEVYDPDTETPTD